MFGLGASEIVVILALALIVFGPQKLPELAKQLARMVGDLRRAADDVKQNFEEATREPPPPPPPPPVAVQALLQASQEAAANKATQEDKAAVVQGALPDKAPLVNPSPGTVPPQHVAPLLAIPTSAPVGTVSASDKPPSPEAPPVGPPPSSGVGHG